MSNFPSVRPVTAVTVTYQSARTIGGTLESIRRCHDAQLLNVVIVDNDSTDATREILQREADWVRIVFSERNIGFGRGCNLGFSHVTSPYTLFVNPDAMVEPEALRTMLHFMEQNPQAGIVGPATLCGGIDQGGFALQTAGRRPTPWTIVRNLLPLVRSSQDVWAIVPDAAPSRTEWVCGAVLLIRSDLMRRLGGFDPRFFLYWEETDLCRRADDIGFESWVLGTALAHHIVSASSAPDQVRVGGSVARHFFQSRYYYMAKHHGWLAATAAEVGEFVLLAVRSVVDWIRGRGLNRLRSRMEAPLLSMPEHLSDEH